MLLLLLMLLMLPSLLTLPGESGHKWIWNRHRHGSIDLTIGWLEVATYRQERYCRRMELGEPCGPRPIGQFPNTILRPSRGSLRAWRGRQIWAMSPLPAEHHSSSNSHWLLGNSVNVWKRRVKKRGGKKTGKNNNDEIKRKSSIHSSCCRSTLSFAWLFCGIGLVPSTRLYL